MKKIILAAVCGLSFLLASCGGGGGGGMSSDSPIVDYQPDTCSEAGQMEFVYKAMHDIYLWADRAPVLDYTQYTSQLDLMEDLKVAEDRYSTIYDKQFLEDYYAGAQSGLGFNAVTNGTDLYVRSVFPDTYAAAAGIKRGDRIITMNGYTAYQILNDDTAYNSIYGNTASGTPVVVVYEDSAHVQHTVTIYMTTYYSDSVLSYAVLNKSGGGKAGYIMYNSFNENASDTSEAFNAFRDAGVDDIIFDIRYNGGGLVTTAQYIASVIGGNALSGNVLLYMLFNNTYSGYNETYHFSRTQYGFNPGKIVFLVSGMTASASELIINGLIPFKDVYVIGTQTYGKPVGTNYVGYCDKYLSAITFQNKNAVGTGGYFDGLTPDCVKTENIANLGTLGDRSEKLLGAAMTYLETGACATEKSSSGDIKVNELEIQAPWDRKIIK